jgi:hypothetical protein
MLILMQRAIDESIDIYKTFTKDFVKVDKLWKLFDNTKEIS